MGLHIAKQYGREPVIEDLWYNRAARSYNHLLRAGKGTNIKVQLNHAINVRR